MFPSKKSRRAALRIRICGRGVIGTWGCGRWDVRMEEDGEDTTFPLCENLNSTIV